MNDCHLNEPDGSGTKVVAGKEDKIDEVSMQIVNNIYIYAFMRRIIYKYATCVVFVV